MKPLLAAVGVIIVVTALSSPMSAQWPAYPTPGVPKTADGKPNLNGPAPRTADGKPDLNGIWLNGRGGGRGQAPANVTFSEGPPVATFRDAGANIKEGLPFQPAAAELVKKRRADNQKDNPDAHCLPMGFMQFHTHGQPRKLVQTPGLLIMMFEPNYGLRQIFTDGRPLPTNDPQPWWYGYSVGKWEGDTLVVETIGLRDDGWLDIWGSPFGESTKVTERFRRPTFGVLEIDVTVDDPKWYTKPWTVRVNQRLMLDSELIEFVCNENQKFTEYLAGASKAGRRTTHGGSRAGRPTRWRAGCGRSGHDVDHTGVPRWRTDSGEIQPGGRRRRARRRDIARDQLGQSARGYAVFRAQHARYGCRPQQNNG